MVDPLLYLPLSSKYQSSLGLYTDLETRLTNELNSPILLEHSGANIYHITTRIKTVDSFIAKVERRQIEKELAFTSITDIVGARIVCMFQEDLEKIHLYLTDCGSFILQSKPKLYQWDNLPWINENEFYIEHKKSGYGAIHYLARLNPNLIGSKSELGQLTFEIQARTLMQESWAALEHAIGYKHNIPERIRGYFDSSAELLGVLDKAFQRLKFQSDKLEGELNVENSITPERLTLFSLKGFIRRQFSDNLPGTQLMPLLEEYRQQGVNISELMGILSKIKYTKLIDDLCKQLLGRPATTYDLLHWVCIYRRADDEQIARQLVEERIRTMREFQEYHASELLTSALVQLGNEEISKILKEAVSIKLFGRQLIVTFNKEESIKAEQISRSSNKIVETGRMIFGPINQLIIQIDETLKNGS